MQFALYRFFFGVSCQILVFWFLGGIFHFACLLLPERHSGTFQTYGNPWTCQSTVLFANTKYKIFFVNFWRFANQQVGDIHMESAAGMLLSERHSCKLLCDEFFCDTCCYVDLYSKCLGFICGSHVILSFCTLNFVFLT